MKQRTQETSEEKQNNRKQREQWTTTHTTEPEEGTTKQQFHFANGSCTSSHAAVGLMLFLCCCLLHSCVHSSCFFSFRLLLTCLCFLQFSCAGPLFLCCVSHSLLSLLSLVSHGRCCIWKNCLHTACACACALVFVAANSTCSSVTTANKVCEKRAAACVLKKCCASHLVHAHSCLLSPSCKLICCEPFVLSFETC